MSSRITKSMLEEKVRELEASALVNKNKIESYDSLLDKYTLLKKARDEDKDKIENANKIVGDLQKDRQGLINTFTNQITQLQTNVGEQNQTILTLFSMIDNSINQQIFYYNKFKEIFINVNHTEE